MVSSPGQVVPCTGGARGTGADTAKELVGRAHKVAITDLDETALNETAAVIGSVAVLSLVAYVCDLSAMQAAADQVVERFGRIDTVVANAGIASYGSVMDVDPATFKRVMDITVLGVFHTPPAKIGSATLGERVCQCCKTPVFAESLKKKNQTETY